MYIYIHTQYVAFRMYLECIWYQLYFFSLFIYIYILSSIIKYCQYIFVGWPTVEITGTVSLLSSGSSAAQLRPVSCRAARTFTCRFWKSSNMFAIWLEYVAMRFCRKRSQICSWRRLEWYRIVAIGNATGKTCEQIICKLKTVPWRHILVAN